MDEATLSNMRDKAEAVATQERDYKRAFAQEREAMEAFLQALQLVIKPALPSLCSPMPEWDLRALHIWDAPEVNYRLYLLEDGNFGLMTITEDQLKLSHPLVAEDVLELIARSVHRDEQVATLSAMVSRIDRALAGQLRGKKKKHEQAVRKSAAKIAAITTLLME